MTPRKLIFTGLLLILTTLVFANTPDTVNITPLTSREVYDDVKKMIDQLAATLSTTTEHIYDVLIRQAIYEGIVASIILLLGIWWTYLATKSMADPDIHWTDGGDATREGVYGWVKLAGGIVFIIIGLCCTSSIIGLINPEYIATREILDFIKAGCK